MIFSHVLYQLSYLARSRTERTYGDPPWGIALDPRNSEYNTRFLALSVPERRTV